MNLILAGFWFIAAILIFFLLYHGEAQQLNFPLPWYVIALILAVYNLLRWLTQWMTKAQRAHEDRPLPRRPLRRASDDITEPDPNFVFTEPAPPAASEPNENPSDNR